MEPSLQQKDIDLFDNLTEQEFIEIRSLFVYERFNKGDFIVQENQMVGKVYFIYSGLVKLSFLDRDINEHILSFAFENWWETDFSAFYNQNKSRLTLQCVEDTETFSLDYQHYLKILENHGISKYFLDKSIRGHIASQKRILTLLTANPKEKYEEFLKLYPSLVQRIPKSMLALYLGVSRETLSRLYKYRNNESDSGHTTIHKNP